MKIRVLSGKFKGRYLFSPNTKDTRVATSRFKKSLFDILMPYLEGARVLDLFAGSGCLGIEALSRGAKSAVFIDMASKPIAALKKNISLLQLESQTNVFQLDAFAFLERNCDLPFDIVLLDPPYPIGEEGYTKLLNLFDEIAKKKKESFLVSVELPKKLQKPLLEKAFESLHLWKDRQSGSTALLIYKSEIIPIPKK